MEQNIRRPRVARVYAWLVTVVPPLLIALAAMVGAGIGIDHDWVEAHWSIWEPFAIVVIFVLTPLAFVAGFPRQLRIAPLTVVLAVLWVLQAVLGHSIDNARWVLSLHIPNAFLIFGLGLFLALLAHRALARYS